MIAAIALHRGLNVGKHHRVRMEELRELYQPFASGPPQTYIQSGNVVFRTAATDLAGLVSILEAAFARRFGFPSPVVLRTAADLRSVVERNPFGPRPFEPAKLQVTFFVNPPSAPVPPDMDAVLSGRELYAYYPDGSGRSPAAKALEAAFGRFGTTRNWKSVCALADLASVSERS